MNLYRSLLALSAGVLLSAVVTAQEWHADASYSWVKNLSRTSFAPYRQTASVYDASVSAEWHRQLAPNWLATGQTTAGWEDVPDFTGLNNFHAGVRVDVRRKFGVGPYAPVAGINGTLTRYDFNENARSNWRAETGIYLKQRLTETWRAAARGNWDDDYAKGRPFDIRNHRAEIETTWDVRGYLQLSAGVSRLWGELTADANANIYARALAGAFGPVVRDYYSMVPYGKTTAFGDNWIAYRVDGRANLWWVGAAVSVSENTSIPLRFETVDFLNWAHIHYRTEIWSLSVLHRF